IDVDTLDPKTLRLMHHCFACVEETFRIRIGLRFGQLENDVAQNFFWRIEAEHTGVADVELENLEAFFLESLRLLQGGSTNFITDVAQFFGLGKHAHGGTVRRMKKE